MRFFLDTEFIEDGKTIQLLSIGVVAEDGRQFYAEVDRAEIDWSKCSKWVHENVEPHLTGDTMPRWSIAECLAEFVDPDEHDGQPPQFWGYYADYDWVVVCQMYGTMMDLPDGWPMFCMDLKQMAVERGNPTLPEQEGTEHNALSDARWNEQVYAFLAALPVVPA